MFLADLEFHFGHLSRYVPATRPNSIRHDGAFFNRLFLNTSEVHFN